MEQTPSAQPASRPPPGVRRPPGAGMDLDASRRPGVPMWKEPKPLPHSRWPITRQQSDVPVYMHGRPHKDFPPVFGTAVPPKGISGLLRKAAYRYPDHVMRHWTMLLLADRVDGWEHRLKKVAPVAVPALLLLGFGAFLRRA